MVILVLCKRRAPAFDSAGDERGRAVMAYALKRFTKCLQAMTAEVRHEFRQRTIIPGPKASA